jgi:CheY-like chemotaxis protein
MAVILIVDDERDNIGVVDYTLTTAGYMVIGVENPDFALANVEEHQPDLIIIDLILNRDYDGVTLGREIREKLAPDTPMIAVTAAVLSYNRKDVLAAGFNDFVSWPLSMHDLRELVRSHL